MDFFDWLESQWKRKVGPVVVFFRSRYGAMSGVRYRLVQGKLIVEGVTTVQRNYVIFQPKNTSAVDVYAWSYSLNGYKKIDTLQPKLGEQVESTQIMKTVKVLAKTQNHKGKSSAAKPINTKKQPAIAKPDTDNVVPQEARNQEGNPVVTISRDYCKQCATVDALTIKTKLGTALIAKETYIDIKRTEGCPLYPYVPGGSSGVTVGYGYDLGHQTADQARHDLSEYYSASDIDKLVKVVGKTGEQAKNALPLVKGVKLSESAADNMLKQVALPKYVLATLTIYPEILKLHPLCQGALVSLVYNRGSKLTGSSRKEMYQIHQALAAGNYAQVPSFIKAMKRLWEGKPAMKGLLSRRDREARFFERGLLAHEKHQ